MEDLHGPQRVIDPITTIFRNVYGASATYRHTIGNWKIPLSLARRLCA